MNKAIEKALEKYPVKERVSYGPYPGASGPSKFDDNKPYRIGYIEGYQQAGKDLELTWEDMKLLDKIFINEKIMSGLILGKKEYEEVLEQFKAQK